MNKHYLPAGQYGWVAGLCYLSITGCWLRINEDNSATTSVVGPGRRYSEFTGVGKHRGLDDEVHA